MRRRVAFIILALLGAAACEDDGSGIHGPECFSIEDCPATNVCFLGNCVHPGFEITTVYAELTPPNNSPWLAQQVPDALDVGDEAIDIPLRAAVLYTGTVLTDGSPPGASSLTGMLTVHSEGSIPGREIVRLASVSSSGFSMQLLPDTYDVSFLPDLGSPPRPPKDFPPHDISANTDQELRYPADSWLVTVQGQVRYTTATQTPVDGARISGVARDAAGNELRSTATLTDSGGEFIISFPPGAQEFDITVGPGSNEFVPVATFRGMSVTQAPDRIDDIILGVSPKVTWDAVVRDKDLNPVQDATIIFDGVVGQGIFHAVASSEQNGGLQSELLPGDYTVTVAPQRADPYAITTMQITIPSSESVVQLTVRDKVRLTGFVSSHDRQPVKGATVTLRLTRSDSPTRREFSTVTGADGWYRVDIDPGTATEPAEYELTIETERTSGLPWFRKLLVVGEDDLPHNVTLYPPSFAYGRVREPGGSPLADVIIAFYSKDLLTSSDLPLLVGVVQTSEDGEFVLPVPTVAVP